MVCTQLYTNLTHKHSHTHDQYCTHTRTNAHNKSDANYEKARAGVCVWDLAELLLCFNSKWCQGTLSFDLPGASQTHIVGKDGCSIDIVVAMNSINAIY